MFSFRILGITAATLASLAAAHPAAAQVTLLSDNFNSENGGVGQTVYSNFANFNVVSNTVDLIGNGLYDYIPGNGLYVDLSGNTNGAIQSKTDFTLMPGTYQLQFDLSNPTGRPTDPIPNSATVTLGTVYNQTFSVTPANTFTHFTENVAVTAPTLGFLKFAENNPTASGDYLDNVSLVQTSTAPVPEASTTVSLGLLLMLGLGGMTIAKKRKSAVQS